MPLLQKDKILKTIFDSIDEINKMLAKELQLKKLKETLLAGENGHLDSLGLINFIVEVESRVKNDYGLELNLIDVLDSPENPMSSIGQLADFIELQANGKSK